jgi:hypothetical protein
MRTYLLFKRDEQEEVRDKKSMREKVRIRAKKW